ncbi:MAG: prolyl oligopeptidase family serine peptidase [Luteitalea sp.]|nr:prolyl oligopeptidase family serine peptidase [Luteitalea sp.]
MTEMTMPESSELRGEAAGVPYVALPPDKIVKDAPLVVIWHLASPPRSETAMAAALPLRGLGAWRVYLGLPMLGSRLPEGGLEEFFRLFREDMMLNVFEPATRQALDELPAALAALRKRLRVGDGPLGLVGGSMGAWVAQNALANTDLAVSAVALVSPAIRATSVVARYERLWDFRYPWNARSRAAADRLDFVARAAEIAERDVATLLVVGALDDEEGFVEPAEELRQLLARRSPARTSLVRIPGMGHPLAKEPGLEPAPQTAHASQVDALVVDWLRRHLTGSRRVSPARDHDRDMTFGT